MPINASHLLENPINRSLQPFTDMFAQVLVSGATFWVFLIAIITFGVFIKTRNVTMTSMFMFVSGALFSTGNIFIGAIEIGMIFTVIAAIGLAIPFINMYFQRNR